MKDVFTEIGIEITPDTKKEIDRVVHDTLGVEYKNCSDTWKKVKEHIKEDKQKRDIFVNTLRMKLIKT
jgi:ATP-dependent Zn protease